MVAQHKTHITTINQIILDHQRLEWDRQLRSLGQHPMNLKRCCALPLKVT